MIGVHVSPEERPIAEEFFQLFKTPWEFAQKECMYDAVVCTEPPAGQLKARLYIIYAAAERAIDEDAKSVRAIPASKTSSLNFSGHRIALSGAFKTFPNSPFRWVLVDGEQPIITAERQGGEKYFYVGYNVFSEAEHLFRRGQKIEDAAAPSLDLHIDILRTIITGAGLSLAEIPPVPFGYTFIASLSHDIDHPLMRNHRFDKTMIGFLYRATIGTIADVFKRRRPVAELWKNLWASATLPFVYLGLLRDPWIGFDKFLEIERGLGATYFVIPVSGDPGRNPHEPVPEVRASSYKLDQIKAPLARIAQAGAELGVHGLNAWLDEKDAKSELDLVAAYSTQTEFGIRMHWLYFDQDSPRKLENAGLRYDSSVGYNETIGYRTGTNQVYRPFGADTLLELPLQIMDTAVFFSGFLNLRREDAMARIEKFIGHAKSQGGVLTINWHDRSLFAERHWGVFYMELIEKLKATHPWFASVSDTVKWFRLRRAAMFRKESAQGVELERSENRSAAFPGLVLRTHRPRPNSWSNTLFDLDNIEVVDQPLNPSMDLNVVV